MWVADSQRVGLKPVPAQAVLYWLDRQAPETLYLTAVSLAELLAGIEVLPQGRRRVELEQAFTRLVFLMALLRRLRLRRVLRWRREILWISVVLALN